MDDIYVSPRLLTMNIMFAICVVYYMLWRYASPCKGPGVWMAAILIKTAGLSLHIYFGNSTPWLLYVLGYCFQIVGDTLLALGIFRTLNIKLDFHFALTRFLIIAVASIIIIEIVPQKITLVDAIYSFTSTVIIFTIYKTLWISSKGSKTVGLERILSISFLVLSIIMALDAAAPLISLFAHESNIKYLILYYAFISYNIDIPVWIVSLMGLALLTMHQILLDSEKNASSAKNMANRFERLMSITNGGVFIAKDGYIYDANIMMSKIFSTNLKSLKGIKILSLFDLSENINEDIFEQIFKSDGNKCDRVAVRSDGNVFFAEFCMTLLDDGCQVGEIRDVSERKKLEHELQALVFKDALTGAFNRRFFLERAEVELARVNRLSNALCLAIFDIDFFKKINDEYGHGMGDNVLVKFSHFCLKNIRSNDIFARYGGEEFVLIMPDTNKDQAMQLLNRLRIYWKNEIFSSQGMNFNSTVSIGYTEVSHLGSTDYWLEFADKALYQSKKHGRDRVSFHD